MTAKVLVVDDHPLVCESVKILLESTREFMWCGNAQTGLEAQEKCQDLRPDIVVMDIELPGRSGIDVASVISGRWSKSRLVILSGHDEPNYVLRCLRAGARGYVRKSDASEDLLEAFSCVMNGSIYLPPDCRHEVLNLFLAGELTVANTPSALSGRQFEVYRLVGEGRKTSEIADLLSLSPKTIQAHMHSIKEKLGISNITMLRNHAIRWQVEHVA